MPELKRYGKPMRALTALARHEQLTVFGVWSACADPATTNSDEIGTWRPPLIRLVDMGFAQRKKDRGAHVYWITGEGREYLIGRMSEAGLECSCTVTAAGTTFDEACPYHGREGVNVYRWATYGSKGPWLI